MSINERLSDLRKAMQIKGLDAYIVPSNDIHQSEYVAEHWNCREWVSGFTGSAGLIVVTARHAGLWTDSRYFLQGEMELAGTAIKLHKPKDRFAPEHITWLNENLPKGAVIGMDGDLCTISQFKKYSELLKCTDKEFDISHDLFDKVWQDRPDIPLGEVYEHDIKFAGKSRVEKIEEIRKEMKNQGVDHHLVTTLDDIAWIFNIRGRDVEFNPVAVAFAIISLESTTLFVDHKKVLPELKTKLNSDGITIKSYGSIRETLAEIIDSQSILIDKSATSVNLYNAINCSIIEGATISTLMKGIKNEVEIQHTREVMAKDGAAIARTFYWLEQQLKHDKKATEAELADKLAENRSQMDDYVGESFPAIVGYKSNGAIIHYRATHDTCKTLKAEGILLVDSGGQYLNGTTDITRTIALGAPSKEEKRNFTLVLKGNLALSTITFPKGTTGIQLDPLARMFLWNQGLNYGHGTGHGVGFFLNVHEGPQGFTGLSSVRGKEPFQTGMITSNEPGYYKEEEYGIRVENLMVTIDSEYEGFLEFETVTLYPMDLKMIDEAIFSKKEKAWLNKYHYHVLKMVGPYLEGDIKSWFEQKCRPMN
ncbi:MAG: Xaa-Pro aminopeptidase [Saprospiraceae bacterium]|jgi:Xaa-Pro aminopeptidase